MGACSNRLNWPTAANTMQNIFYGNAFKIGYVIRRKLKERKMAFRNFLTNLVFFPKVQADSEEEPELVDPQTTLREKCQTHGNIEALYQKYQECNDRVNSRSKTTETCMEELFDYVAELDHCVAHSLWPKLK